MAENKWNPKCEDMLVNLEMQETDMICYLGVPNHPAPNHQFTIHWFNP